MLMVEAYAILGRRMARLNALWHVTRRMGKNEMNENLLAAIQE
jgi:hypothetical protein